MTEIDFRLTRSMTREKSRRREDVKFQSLDNLVFTKKTTGKRKRNTRQKQDFEPKVKRLKGKSTRRKKRKRKPKKGARFMRNLLKTPVLTVEKTHKLSQTLSSFSTSVSSGIYLSRTEQKNLLEMLSVFSLPTNNDKPTELAVRNVLTTISNIIEQNVNLHTKGVYNFPDISPEDLLSVVVESKKDSREGCRLYIKCLANIFNMFFLAPRDSKKILVKKNIIHKTFMVVDERGREIVNFKLLNRTIDQLFETYIHSFNRSVFVHAQNCVIVLSQILYTFDRERVISEMKLNIFAETFSPQHFQFFLLFIRGKLEKTMLMKEILSNYYVSCSFGIDMKKILNEFLVCDVVTYENDISKCEKFYILIKEMIKNVIQNEANTNPVKREKYKKLLNERLDVIEKEVLKDKISQSANLKNVLEKLRNVI